MLSISNICGLASLMITVSYSTRPLGSMYNSMKRLSENQSMTIHSILLALSQSSIWMLYAYINMFNAFLDNYYLLISFTYATLLHIIYVNMFLYSIQRKNYMLLYSLAIVSIIYIIKLTFPLFLLGIIGITLCGIDISKCLYVIRQCAQIKNVSMLNFSKIFALFFMGMIWLIYALCNRLWSFCIGMNMIMLIKMIEMIVFLWGVGRIEDNSIIIRIVKVVLFIRQDEDKDDKEKVLIQLKEAISNDQL